MSCEQLYNCFFFNSFEQEIRALFPPEHNPFYAGFGNRNTDEISYLEVGIPRGKIFTINPKVPIFKILNTLLSNVLWNKLCLRSPSLYCLFALVLSFKLNNDFKVFCSTYSL